SFNISQRDITNLEILKEVLDCGIIKKRMDGVHSLDITTPAHIILRVIPFFKRFPFLSKKATKNFAIFCKIANLVHKGDHRNKKGLTEILQLREILNEGKGRKRKYSANDVIKTF